jgi:ADP-ribose pyrophosphatase YjhB (NUDIX family)
MSKERRERLPVSVSAAVFIEDAQGRLLLVQQAAEWKGKKWGPPAGGMNAHESPMDTALREVEEEIDVEVKLIDVLGVYTADRGGQATGLACVFRGEIVEGEIKPREGEIADYRFFTPDEIEQLIAEEKLYKPEYNLAGIEDWLVGRSYPLEVIKPLSS